MNFLHEVLKKFAAYTINDFRSEYPSYIMNNFENGNISCCMFDSSQV